MGQKLQCVFHDCRPRRTFKGERGLRKHLQMVHGQSALFNGVDTTTLQFEEMAESDSSEEEPNHDVEPMDITSESTPDERDNETLYHEGKGFFMMPPFKL